MPAGGVVAMTAEELFAGRAVALSAHRRVLDLLEEHGPVEVRVQRSQLAYWRTHGFAYLWLPDHYLGHADAEVVLTIALGRHDPSPRWKQVVHPSARHWVHHLEIDEVREIDDEVVGWLLEAADRA